MGNNKSTDSYIEYFLYKSNEKESLKITITAAEFEKLHPSSFTKIHTIPGLTNT